MASPLPGSSYPGTTPFPTFGAGMGLDRCESSPNTPSHSLPPSRDGPTKLDKSPTDSDDSVLWDLSEPSLVYGRNSRGEIVRVSTGSTKSSTSPTPMDSPPNAPLPTPATTYARPAPLASSESLPQESICNPRQLQRVVSGPVSNTPAGLVRGYSSLATANPGMGRKIGGPRHIRLEDLPKGDSKPAAQTAIGAVDEKENMRATRMVCQIRSIPSKSLGFNRISEANEEPDRFPPSLSPALARPRPPSHPPLHPRTPAPFLASAHPPPLTMSCDFVSLSLSVEASSSSTLGLHQYI